MQAEIPLCILCPDLSFAAFHRFTHNRQSQPVAGNIRTSCMVCPVKLIKNPRTVCFFYFFWHIADNNVYRTFFFFHAYQNIGFRLWIFDSIHQNIIQDFAHIFNDNIGIKRLFRYIGHKISILFLCNTFKLRYILTNHHRKVASHRIVLFYFNFIFCQQKYFLNHSVNFLYLRKCFFYI